MDGPTLRLLGGFSLADAGGREVALPGRKTRMLLAYLALNAAIVLLVPFFFAGLAVVHAFAGGRQARTLLLMVFYFFLLVSGWPIAMVVGLGVIEQWAGLRRRFSRTGPDQES